MTPTTGDPENLITCVGLASIQSYGPDCTDLYGLRDIYLQALCAKTFGGVPSDYVKRPTGGWSVELDDYPTSAHDDNSDCDVTWSFGMTDEIPVATDAELLSTGRYNRCSRESYCETLNEIIDEFPTESIDPDPWCNISPGGDEERPHPWRCVGSKDDACGFAYLPPTPSEQSTLCPFTTPGGKEWCVIAVSEMEASSKCRDVCVDADEVYDDEYGPVWYPNPEGQLDCSVYAANAMLWVSDVEAQCANPYQDMSALTKVPFSFEADLWIAGGANASSSNNASVGFIAYRVENCVRLACDIVIEGVELSYLMYTGTYHDGNNIPSPYSMDGVSISLVAPVSGTITPSTFAAPAVTFPSEKFHLRLSTGDVVLDTVSLGALGLFGTTVDQVTGFYSKGVLTLTIAYETPDATMVLTLTTF